MPESVGVQPGEYVEPGGASGSACERDRGPLSAYGTPTCAHCTWGIPEDREDDCPKCGKIIHILCAHTCPEVDGVEWPSGGPLDYGPPKAATKR